ncbi:MAG: hypothetical protein PHP59_04750 [Methanofollis sp.]|uniref:hypothetical protein n=1 Tax=Methanofollis sp. TaxID=2052835 RepID=UPI002622B9A2|nr:hypothetical protein [Methanofollis sp.]MDD4254669.1 hypothetical protein [Methanofollis sp.]
MPRLLSEKDLAMLRKLAPECSDLVCAGSGVPFRSLLPPVANHFAAGPDDFGVRLARLDDDELRTLVGLIETGEESLGCVPPACADVLISLLATRLGSGTAGRVLGIYEAAAGCEERGI